MNVFQVPFIALKALAWSKTDNQNRKFIYYATADNKHHGSLLHSTKGANILIVPHTHTYIHPTPELTKFFSISYLFKIHVICTDMLAGLSTEGNGELACL